MARQNAKRKTNRRNAPANSSFSALGGIVWLVLGLIAGLLIASLFYLKQQHTLAFNASKSQGVQKNSHTKTPEFDFYHILADSKHPMAAASVAEKQEKVSLQAPEVKLPSANTPETVSEKSESTAISSENVTTDSETLTVNTKPTEPINSAYMVQIASVKNYDEADKLKAQLSLLGFDVSIQKITAGDKILNRVIIGPFETVGAAQEQQKRLRENNISSIVVKSENISQSNHEQG